MGHHSLVVWGREGEEHAQLSNASMQLMFGRFSEIEILHERLQELYITRSLLFLKHGLHPPSPMNQ